MRTSAVLKSCKSTSPQRSGIAPFLYRISVGLRRGVVSTGEQSTTGSFWPDLVAETWEEHGATCLANHSNLLTRRALSVLTTGPGSGVDDLFGR